MNMSDFAKIRHDLLIWAGYHRGTGISEEAMPRFHEIIDELSRLIIQPPDLYLDGVRLSRALLPYIQRHFEGEDAG